MLVLVGPSSLDEDTANSLSLASIYSGTSWLSRTVFQRFLAMVLELNKKSYLGIIVKLKSDQAIEMVPWL